MLSYFFFGNTQTNTPSLGMFLYVRIIFDMIRYSDSVDDILKELKYPPESLDDA